MEHYGLSRRLAAAAIRFDALARRACPVRAYEALAKFPAVRRDLSLIVQESVTWRQLAEVIESVPQPMRVGVEYVTTYRGKPVPKGDKSVTVTLIYRWSEGTLRGEQVDQQVAEIVSAAGEKLTARLRA
jgi:phenylalanyl-tRNA synthetase beta chain